MKTTNTKIVLVTGGSRGIGKSIALNAAQRGIDVILTYNSNSDQGKAVADTINTNGGKAVALPLDMSQSSTFSSFADQVSQVLKQEWNRENLDYLVNNAGISQRMLIKDTTEELFDELVDVNFKGVFFLMAGSSTSAQVLQGCLTPAMRCMAEAKWPLCTWCKYCRRNWAKKA